MCAIYMRNVLTMCLCMTCLFPQNGIRELPISWIIQFGATLTCFHLSYPLTWYTKHARAGFVFKCRFNSTSALI